MAQSGGFQLINGLVPYSVFRPFYYRGPGGEKGLVSLPVFKTGEAGHPGLAGSIPVRLR